MIRIKKDIIGRLFDGRVGVKGTMQWDIPDEPTPETAEKLKALATARRNFDPLLVGIYQGFWVQIEDYYTETDEYLIRQLYTDDGPQFMSTFEPKARVFYCAEIRTEELKRGLSWLMLFDPILGCTL